MRARLLPPGLVLALLACAHAPTRADLLDASKAALLASDTAFRTWHAAECEAAGEAQDGDRLARAVEAREQWERATSAWATAILLAEARDDEESLAAVRQAADNAMQLLAQTEAP